MRWGERVKVYRNLHKDQWSLMGTEGPQRGRVVGYADEVWIEAPELTVSEASRQRAIREQSRNVHAFVVGRVVAPGGWDGPLYRVRYNPFRAGCFTDAMERCVVRGQVAHLDGEGLLWMDTPGADAALLVAQMEGEIRRQMAGQADAATLAALLRQNRADIERRVQGVLGVWG